MNFIRTIIPKATHIAALTAIIASGWGATHALATDFYWSGQSGTSDNIDQGANWFNSGANPSSGDNLYFNNTSGSRHWPYSNYGAGSYFNYIITYSGAGGIKWRGDTTYANKFENNNDPFLFEIEANIGNRSGPDTDMEINPVGSGGIQVDNLVTITGGKTIKVYGNNTLTLNGVVSGASANLTLSPTGGGFTPTVVMSAENTFTGNLTINGGIADLRNTTDPLDVANIFVGDTSGALAATLRIGANGVTVDNAVTVQSGNSGTMKLQMNTTGDGTLSGAVTLNKAATADVVSGGTLTIGGAISGSGALTKTSAGTLVLTNANTYTGVTTVNAGTLTVTGSHNGGQYIIGAAAGDNGTLNINATGYIYAKSVDPSVSIANVANSTGTVVMTSGTLVSANSTWIATGSGSRGVFNLSGGSVIATNWTVVGNGAGSRADLNITGGSWSNVNSSYGFTIGAGSGTTATGNVTVANGILFSQKNFFVGENGAGSLTVNSGTVTTPGTLAVGANSGAHGVLTINGGSVSVNNLQVTTSSGAVGAVYQTGGTNTINQAANTANLPIGAATGAYGYYKLSGGRLYVNEAGIGGAFNNAVGVMEITGGTFTNAGWLAVARGSGGSGLLNVDGGNVDLGGTVSGSRLSLNTQGFVGTGSGTAVVNLKNGRITGAAASNMYLEMNEGANAANVSAFNLLNGGVLTIYQISAVQTLGTTLFNFNGGTLKATTANAGANFLTSANIDHVYLYSNGGTIDDNGTSITVSRPLEAPTGNGVTTIDVASKGSGYLGAPLVTITGGTGGPATAVANMEDDGTGNGTYRVASITISSPGSYSVDPTAVTLTGGGALTAASGFTINTAANTSGGIIKNGTGTLTLSGASTYSGGTTHNAGWLVAGNNAAFGTGAVILNGATLQNNAGVTLTNNITASANKTNTIDVLTGNFTLNGNISGSGVIVRGTAQTLTLYLGGDNGGFSGMYTSPANGNAVIRFGSATAGSSNAVWFFNSSTATRQTLDFNNGTIYFGSFNGTGQINNEGGTSAATNTMVVGALGGSASYSGVIADGAQIMSLIKTGTGVQVLGGANTFTGPVLVNGGTLITDRASAANNVVLSFVSGVTVTNATLISNSNALFGWDGTQARTLTLNAGGTAISSNGDTVIGNVILNGGTLASVGDGSAWGTWTFGRAAAKLLTVTDDSTITASWLGLHKGATVDVANAKTLSISGFIADGTSAGLPANDGPSALLKTGGNGTIILTGTNTYTGATTVNTGTLIVGGAGRLGSGSYGGAITNNANFVYASTRDQSLTGVINGNGTLIMSGSGTLTLQNNANTYSGGTIVNAGTLANNLGAPGSAGTITPFGSGSITVSNGATLRLGVNPGGQNNGHFYLTNSVVLNNGTIFEDDSIQHITGNFSVGANGGTLGSTYNTGAADVNKGLYFDGVVSGSGALTVQHTRISVGNTYNTSFVAFTNNNNTYSGTINVNQNTGAIEGGVYLGVNGTYALSNATINLLANLTSSGAKFGSSPIVFNTGLGTAYIGSLTGTGQVVLTGYNETTHAYGTDSIALNVGANNADSSFYGVTSGGGSLTKAGTGVFTLAGANTYSGNTLIIAGQLVLSNANAVQNSTVSNMVNDGVGFSVNATTIGGLAGTGNIGLTNGTNAVTLTVGNNNTTNTYSGALSGSGGLTKTGSSGTQILSGNNSYNGNTTINAGTLQFIGASAMSGNSTMALANASTLALRADANTTFTPAGIANISGSTATINVDQVTSGGGNGGHKITLSGSFYINGNATLNLSTGSGDTLALGTINLNAGSQTETLNASAGSKVTVAGVQTYGVYDTLAFAGAGNIDVLGAMVQNTSARWLGLQFNQTGTATVWAANNLNGANNGNPAYAPPVNFNSGITVFNNSGALNSVAPTRTYMGASSGSSSATVLLGGTDSAGLLGGVTLNPWLWNGTINVQDGSSGQLTIGGLNTNGVNTWASTFTLGVTANTGKSVTLVAATGGEVDFTGSILANGSDTSAGLTINDATHAGTVKFTGANTYGGNTLVSNGRLILANTNAVQNSTVSNLVNGALVFTNFTRFNLGGLAGTGNIGLTNTAGTAITLLVGTNNASTTYSGVLSGTGSLTKNGNGKLELTGANLYTGTTIINAGILAVNNTTGSGLGTGAVSVNGGTLGGTGTVAGAVTLSSGGALAPGNSVGIQHMGTLTLNGGTLNFQFQTYPGLNDQIIVDNGNGLTINSAGFNLLTENGTSPSGDRFTDFGLYNLINYSGTLGGVGITGLSVLNPAGNRTYAFGDSGSWITLTIGGQGIGWTGTAGAPGNWSTTGNWNVAVSQGDLLVFDGHTTTSTYNDFTAGTWFSGIMFTNTANPFTLDGHALNLRGNVVNLSSFQQTINTPLVLEGGSRVFAASGGDILVNTNLSQTGGSYGLVKTGSHTLSLAASNTYTGVTEIQGGALRATDGYGLPTASNLKLNGGVLESSGTFSRSLGSNAGSVQWTGSGGFSAHGGTLSVNIGGAGAGQTWGAGNFVPTGSALIFSSDGADRTVKFINPIDLGGSMRTVQVANGAAFVDVDMIGAITGTSGGLSKTGNGGMRLTGNSSFSGPLNVDAGALVVNGSVTAGSGLTLGTGTYLYGTGTIGRVVSGSGTIAPGSSPGILTVNQLDPSANMNFNFEFTNIGSPEYTQPGASSNDVLRITNSTPFTVALGITNTVNLYVNTTLVTGQTNTFRGGFYTDNSANFDGTITNATYNWYLNSVLQSAPLLFVRTVDETGNQFGSINGHVMEFGVFGQPLLVVPEPFTILLLGFGGFVLWLRRKPTKR